MKKSKRVYMLLSAVFCGLLLVLAAGGAADAMMLNISLEELIEGSDSVLAGEVLSIESQWNEDRSSIYSTVVVEVEEGFKGQGRGTQITVVVPGGEAEGITQKVSNVPGFSKGERAMLFLKRIPYHRIPAIANIPFTVYELHGLFQGKKSLPPGELDSPEEGDLNTRIRAIVVDEESVEAQNTGDDELTLETSGFVYNGMSWPGSPPVVGYKVNAPIDRNSNVQAAAATWSGAGANFTLNYEGTHSRSGNYSRNYVNEIIWYNMGTTSTLAVAAWWYNSNNQILEADIIFNSNHQWSTATPTPSGHFDVQTVALHEFGHWLSLGHSEIIEAIMWWQYKGMQRSLHSDDLLAIKYIYGEAPCVVETPTKPSGPTSGYVNTEYLFSSSGSSCSNGHAVEYRFRWASAGEPEWNYGGWSALPEISITFMQAGTYLIEAEARCLVSGALSGFSENLAVEIGVLPTAPLLSLPENGVYFAGTAVAFEWGAVDNAVRYELSVENADSGETFYSHDLGDVAFFTLEIFPDESGAYRWSVRAGDSEQWGPASEWRNFYLDNEAPQLVTDSISINPGKVESGDEITFSAAATDDHFGVYKFIALYRSPSGNAAKEFIWLSEQPGETSVEINVSLEINGDDEIGDWVLESIYSEDYAGNYKYYSGSELSVNGEYDFTIDVFSGFEDSPIEYDLTLTLGAGWSLLSLPLYAEAIVFTASDIEAWLTLKEGQWLSGNMDNLTDELNNPARAIYIKTVQPTEIQINWAELTPQLSFASQQLSPGWNLIGCGIDAGYDVILADIISDGISGLTQLYAPNYFNARKEQGYYRNWHTSLVNLALLNNLEIEKMFPFDGYWVFLHGESLLYSTPVNP